MNIFDPNNDFAKKLNHVENERYLSLLTKTFLHNFFLFENRFKKNYNDIYE